VLSTSHSPSLLGPAPPGSDGQTSKRSTVNVWATVCKTVRPMLWNRGLSCLSVLSVMLVYCGQTVGTWMDQDDTWYGGRPRLWPRHVRWEPSSSPKRGTAPPPNFHCHLSGSNAVTLTENGSFSEFSLATCVVGERIQQYDDWLLMRVLLQLVIQQ